MKRITRAKFLTASGALAVVAAGSYLPWGIARADEANDVLRYGVKGDGVANDWRALQDALDATREYEREALYVNEAPAYYAIDRKLRFPDETEVYGAGMRSSSHIRNVFSRADTEDARAGVFDMGNCQAGFASSHSIENEPFDLCPGVKTGDAVLALSDPARASCYSAGTLVWMHDGRRDRAYLTTGGPLGVGVYGRAEINEVTAVGHVEGTLTLKHPVSEDFARVYVAPSPSVTQSSATGPMRICKRPILRDLVLSNRKDSRVGLIPHGGSFEARIERIGVPECAAFFSYNGFSRGYLGDCEVRRARKLFDVAYWSHHYRIERVEDYRLQGTEHEDSAIFMGQNTHHFSWYRVRTRQGRTSPPDGGDKDARRGMLVSGVRHGSFREGLVAARDCPEAGIKIESSAEGQPHGFVLADTRVEVGAGAGAGIEVRSTDRRSPGRNVYVARNTVFGSPRDEQIVVRAGSVRHEVRGNRARVWNRSGTGSFSGNASYRE